MTSSDGMDPRALAVAIACKGFLDQDEGRRLHDLARDHAHIGPIVEIGSYAGKSSVYLGAGVKRSGGTLVCVDHHRGNEEQQVGEEYHDPDLFDPEAGRMESLHHLRRAVRLAGLEETVILAVGGSAQVAGVWSTPLGMVFIDGGHSQAAADTDYAAWAPQVAPGGILAIHDLFPDPSQGGQAPINIYRRALSSGEFDELPTTKTLGVLKKRKPALRMQRV